MGRRPEPDPVQHDDEQLGEAIEVYLALAEAGSAPEPEEFASRYPDFHDDLLAALEGLALVQGLVGDSSHGHGHGGRLETGRKIAGYRIVRELGRGGMGVVYEAVHVALDRPVALKVLATPAAPDSSGRRRFLNEAKTAAGLHHTHIVPVFDVGQVGGLSYYAMQRIEGSGLDRVVKHLRRGRATAAGNSHSNATPFWSRLNSLRPSPGGRSVRGPIGSDSVTASWNIDSDRPGPISGLIDPTLSRSGTNFGLSNGGAGLDRSADRDDSPPPFEPPRGSSYYRWVADVGLAAADALDHAHTRGVIHRDIKPSNLLVDGRGFVWVADFGLARRLADPDQTHHESLIGTPRYMSPEQARSGPVDGRTDLYSLGATLYELLALRPPFDGRSTAELVEQIAKLEPPSPRQSDPKIPRDLETIVLKLLSKRPTERYANAAELAEDLTRFLHFEPVRARRISPAGRFIRFAKRHPSGTAVTAAAAATVLAVSTWAYLSVLDQRNVAVKARADTEIERNAAIQAREETDQALQKQLYSEATGLLASHVPNRRVKGLKLLGDAAARKPGPLLQGNLRNEAVEFLVIRDVEARPGFLTGRARGLAFGADGTRLASLTQNEDGGDFFSLFDVPTHSKVAERPLRDREDARAPGSGAQRSGGQGGSGGGGSGGRRGGGRMDFGPMMSGPTIASAGEAMAVVSPDGRGLRLYDASTGARMNDLAVPANSGRVILALLASPDGGRLVTTEIIFSGLRGDRSRPGQGPPPPPPDEASPGATKGAYPPPTPPQFMVNLWDSKSIFPDKSANDGVQSKVLDKPLKTLVQYDQEPGFRFESPLVAISPDGKTLVTSRPLKTALSFWSVDTGEAIGVALDTQTELTALAIGTENQLATAGSGEIRLWDLNSRTPLQSLTPNQSAVKLLRYSPRGPFLVAVGLLGRDIELWDTDAHSRVAVLSSAERIDDVAFSPDGRSLAAAGTGAKTQVWEIVDPNVRVRLSGFDSVTRSMAFRPDGLLALGSWQGTTRFWNAGRCFNSLAKTAGAATTIAHAATQTTTAGAVEESRDDSARRDGPTLLAFDDHGRLMTYERETLRLSANPLDRLESTDIDLPEVKGASFSPFVPMALAASANGERMAIARSGQVMLWTSSEPDRVVTIKPPAAPPSMARVGGGPGGGGPGGGGGGRRLWRAMAVSPAGDRVYLIDGFGTFVIWAVQGQKAEMLTWRGVPNRANALALSPSEDLLAMGDVNGSITLVQTATGKVRAKFVRDDPEGRVEAGRVEALAFSPDGRKLAVGTQQGHIDIWSLSNPNAAPLRLPGHRSLVTALAFDPKGQYLASAGGDRTADVWNLDRLREEFEKLGLAW